MLKVALVGVGGISGAHIPAWEAMADAELVALCDIRPEQMEKYPDKHHYTDFGEMLDNEQIDILDICLPTYLHADFAVQAMQRGIHVLCEKPVSLKREFHDRTGAAVLAGIRICSAGLHQRPLRQAAVRHDAADRRAAEVELGRLDER